MIRPVRRGNDLLTAISCLLSRAQTARRTLTRSAK